MSKCHYLVAGLPELTSEDSKLSYAVADPKTEIYTGLSTSDQRLIDLSYLKPDDANVLRLLKDREATINTWGNLSAKEPAEYISVFKEGGEISIKESPTYLATFISDYFNTPADNVVLPEDHLVILYYDYAMKRGNKFVASWFEFNLTINNILMALTARKYKWDVVRNIMDDTEVYEALRTSGIYDFGLSGEMDFSDQLVKTSEIAELVGRRKKSGVLRWNWVEEAIFLNYLIVERTSTFLLELETIECWIFLNKEGGNQLFRSIIESLKNEIQIPAEFKQSCQIRVSKLKKYMATRGTVSGVIINVATLAADRPVVQNKICYILTGDDKLMTEVIKVVGIHVYAQAFENIHGLKVGAEVEFVGHMLEVTLGPGMLSENYDGLQNDLDKIDGVFLRRGQHTYPLDKESVWYFVPLVNVGDRMKVSTWLGRVDGGFQPLEVVVPPMQKGVHIVKSTVPEGGYKIEDVIAVLVNGEGSNVEANMI